MAGRFSITAVFGARDNLSRVFSAIEGRAKRAFRGIESAGARARATLSSMAAKTDQVIAGIGRTSKALAIAGGTAAAIGAASVVTAGANFEEAISAVGAVSLMTRDQIADLEKKALELGSSTKFTATQVANGMELMGRAGFTNAEILSGIPGLLAAAAAEGGDLAETVGIVSNTLKGMGLAAGETQRVADVLALASARTNSSITSLGESLKNAAPIARQFNIPLEQVTASVALLQDVGIDASEAGTATATMLTLLASPTKQAAAQMSALGIKIADARGNMLPLPKIFEQFAAASKKAGGNVKAAAVFSELLGMRGQRAGLNLVNAFTSGKFAEVTKELENAAGSSEKMAAIRMDNLKGDWERLTGAIDGVSTAVFGLQSGGLRSVVQSITTWIDKNKEFVGARIDGVLKDVKSVLKDVREEADRLMPKVEWFSTGFVRSLRDVGDAASATSKAIGLLVGNADGLFGDNEAENAYGVGRAIGFAGVALVGVSVASRAATVATYGYRAAVVATNVTLGIATPAKALFVAATNAEALATGRATASAWLNVAASRARSVALALGAIATTRITGATIAASAATAANTVATWAKNAAHTAHNAAVGMGTTLTGLFTVATSRDTIAAIASKIATWARVIAQRAHTLALGIGASAQYMFAVATGKATAVTVTGTAALGAARASMLAFGLAAGAATAALAAWMVAWNQNEDLKKQTQGLGFFDIAGGMIEQGTLNPFDVVDKHQNELARAARPDAAKAWQQQGSPSSPAARDQGQEQGKLIAAEVKRALESTKIQVEVSGGDGKVAATTSKGTAKRPRTTSTGADS